MVDYVSNHFLSIPGLQLEYKNIVWGGYQNFDFKDLHAIMLGVDIKQKIRIGCSYSFNDFMDIEGANTIEFMLGYRLQ